MIYSKNAIILHTKDSHTCVRQRMEEDRARASERERGGGYIIFDGLPMFCAQKLHCKNCNVMFKSMEFHIFEKCGRLIYKKMEKLTVFFLVPICKNITVSTGVSYSVCL